MEAECACMARMRNMAEVAGLARHDPVTRQRKLLMQAGTEQQTSLIF